MGNRWKRGFPGHSGADQNERGGESLIIPCVTGRATAPRLDGARQSSSRERLWCCLFCCQSAGGEWFYIVKASVREPNPVAWWPCRSWTRPVSPGGFSEQDPHSTKQDAHHNHSSTFEVSRWRYRSSKRGLADGRSLWERKRSGAPCAQTLPAGACGQLHHRPCVGWQISESVVPDARRWDRLIRRTTGFVGIVAAGASMLEGWAKVGLCCQHAAMVERASVVAGVCSSATQGLARAS